MQFSEERASQPTWTGENEGMDALKSSLDDALSLLTKTADAEAAGAVARSPPAVPGQALLRGVAHPGQIAGAALTGAVRETEET